ncbi:hypothetical protein C8J56DRAFT_1091269 [Mycena floridula]|nr:hypothetical protein C8J56DRAFT_1091269 [Mycena floridula]
MDSDSDLLPGVNSPAFWSHVASNQVQHQPAMQHFQGPVQHGYYQGYPGFIAPQFADNNPPYGLPYAVQHVAIPAVHHSAPIPASGSATIRPTLGQIVIQDDQINPLKRRRVDSQGDTKKIPLKKERKEEDDDEVFASGKGQWSKEERGKLYSYFLDAGNDDKFATLAFKKSAMKKASQLLFKEKRNHSSVSSLWDRTMRTYKLMVAFYTFTGGAGDGDGDPDGNQELRLQERLQKAKVAGKAVGTLKAAEIELWNKKGWYDLFHVRYGTKPNITRAFERHSNGEVSGDDEPVSQPSQTSTQPPESDGDTLIGSDASSRRATSVPFSNWERSPSPAVTASIAIKSEPDVKPPLPQQQISSTNNNSITSVSTNLLGQQSDYLQERSANAKVQLDIIQKKEEREAAQNAERLELEKKKTHSELEDRQNRLEIERERLRRESEQWEHSKIVAKETQELEKKKYKVDAAHKIIGNPNITDRVRDAADQFLFELFST